MKIIRTHIIPADIQSIRLEEYILQNFTVFPSKKGIQKSIKRGLVLLNHEVTTTGTWVNPGQRIDWLEAELVHPVYPMKMEVVYEDEYLALINKPPGIIVSGNQHRTVTNALSFVLKKSPQEDHLMQPQPAHRLDAATSGLLLVAKTSRVLILLNKLFEEKNIVKEYQAIVQGKIPISGTIDFNIEAKIANTDFERITYSRSINNDWVSEVKLSPKTGRTHQLRIHMASLGFPIVGDRLYGTEGNVLKGKGLFLCASRLKFKHPVSDKEIDIEISVPNKFKNYILREENRWLQFREQL